MNYKLAIYDPAATCASGVFWPYRHSDLSQPVLDDLYYNHLKQSIPTNIETVTADTINGGCVLLSPEWGVWYRFINGGRDQFDRLGRYLVLCGFISRRDMQGMDTSKALTASLFQPYIQSIPSIPLQQPPMLEGEIAAVPEMGSLNPSDREALLAGRGITGPNAIDMLSQFIAEFAGKSDVLRGKITQTSIGMQVTVKIRPTKIIDRGHTGGHTDTYNTGMWNRLKIPAIVIAVLFLVGGISYHLWKNHPTRPPVTKKYPPNQSGSAVNDRETTANRIIRLTDKPVVVVTSSPDVEQYITEPQFDDDRVALIIVSNHGAVPVTTIVITLSGKTKQTSSIKEFKKELKAVLDKLPQMRSESPRSTWD